MKQKEKKRQNKNDNRETALSKKHSNKHNHIYKHTKQNSPSWSLQGSKKIFNENHFLPRSVCVCVTEWAGLPARLPTEHMVSIQSPIQEEHSELSRGKDERPDESSHLN